MKEPIMTNRENNKIYTRYAIIFFLFAYIFSANGQSTSKVTEDLVIKLQQKVLLNQKQADEIKKSLNEYLMSPTEDNRNALESKIESLLEEKQKMKYAIIKKSWWENVSKEINRIKRKND
jgi:hypothetical protein